MGSAPSGAMFSLPGGVIRRQQMSRRVHVGRCAGPADPLTPAGSGYDPAVFAPDVSVLTWLAGHRTGWATRLSSWLMSASGSVPVVGGLLVLAAAYVVFRRRWSTAVVVGSAAFGAVVVTGALKALIGRPRPPAELALVTARGFSMPSTDGALTAAAALALLLVTGWSTRNLRRAGAAVLAVAVVFVGVCLVYLGAHWPSDVLAGWAVGALVAWGCDRGYRWMRHRGAGAPVAG